MFHTIISVPLTNVLVFLTAHLWGNIGLAVIVMTIIVKLILLPFSFASTRNQIAMKKIQPIIDEMKKNTPDKNEQTKKMMEIYKEHQTNPLSGCLPLLIQLPIILGLYRVFLQGLSIDTATLYHFVHAPEYVSNTFLGISMTSKSIILATIAGITQYIQLRLSPSFQNNSEMKKTEGPEDFQTALGNNMQKAMKFSLPVMITIFAAVVPAAVALYWVVTNIFTIGQEWWINWKIKKRETIVVKNI
jgi:YidC/Oxa1 family membrane protein insertase